MIPVSIILRRLEHERATYGRELETDFVRGVREGLAISIRIIKDLWDEVRENLRNPWGRRMLSNLWGAKRGPRKKVNHDA